MPQRKTKKSKPLRIKSIDVKQVEKGSNLYKKAMKREKKQQFLNQMRAEHKASVEAGLYKKAVTLPTRSEALDIDVSVE